MLVSRWSYFEVAANGVDMVRDFETHELVVKIAKKLPGV